MWHRYFFLKVLNVHMDMRRRRWRWIYSTLLRDMLQLPICISVTTESIWPYIVVKVCVLQGPKNDFTFSLQSANLNELKQQLLFIWRYKLIKVWNSHREQIFVYEFISSYYWRLEGAPLACLHSKTDGNSSSKWQIPETLQLASGMHMHYRLPC